MTLDDFRKKWGTDVIPLFLRGVSTQNIHMGVMRELADDIQELLKDNDDQTKRSEEAKWERLGRQFEDPPPGEMDL